MVAGYSPQVDAGQLGLDSAERPAVHLRLYGGTCHTRTVRS